MASGNRSGVRLSSVVGCAALAGGLLASCGRVSTSPAAPVTAGHGKEHLPAYWSGCGPPSEVHSARVMRTDEFPGNHLPPSRSSPRSVVLGAAPARHLYEAACRVLAITQHLGAISCPADLGVYYHLYFSGGKGIVGAMTYVATGCETLAVGKGPTNGPGGTSIGTPGGRSVAVGFAAYRHPKRCDPFLSDLAGTMGLTRGQLRP